MQNLPVEESGEQPCLHSTSNANADVISSDCFADWNFGPSASLSSTHSQSIRHIQELVFLTCDDSAGLFIIHNRSMAYFDVDRFVVR